MSRNNRRTKKNAKARQWTNKELRNFVMREAAKLSGELEPVENVSAEEVEANEFADTLEQDLDMYKAMKIQEADILKKHKEIIKEARRIRYNKRLAKKRILRRLK